MKKKFITWLLIMVLGLSVLTSCGGNSNVKTSTTTADEENGFTVSTGENVTSGGNSNTNASNVSTSKNGTAGENSSPVKNGDTNVANTKDANIYTGRAKDLKGKVIKVHGWATGVATTSGTGLVAQRAKALVSSIEKTLNCKLIISSNSSQYDESVNASLAAGKPKYDIVWLSPGLLMSNVLFNRLVPLDDLKVINFSDRSRYTVATDLAIFNSKHYGIGPKTYGFTSFFNNTALFANLDILKSAGVTITDLQNWVKNKQWTWSKFAEVGSKVKGTNKKLIIDAMDAGGRFSDFYQALLISNNTDWVSKKSNSNYLFTGDSASAQSALNSFKSLKDNGYLDFSATDSTPEKDFIAGKSAFLTAPLYAPNFNSAATTYGNYTIVPLPMGDKANSEYSLGTSDYTFAAIGRGQKPSGATDAEIATVLDLLQTNMLSQAENDSLILTETVGMAKNALATDTIKRYNALFANGKGNIIWSQLVLNKANIGVNWMQDVYAFAKGSKGKAEILAQISSYNSILAKFNTLS